MRTLLAALVALASAAAAQPADPAVEPWGRDLPTDGELSDEARSDPQEVTVGAGWIALAIVAALLAVGVLAWAIRRRAAWTRD